VTAPYLDPSRSVDDRVKDLLGRMTIEEKLAQLGSRYIHELLVGHDFDSGLATKLIANGVGHISRIGGAAALDPQGVVDVANDLQRFLVEHTRLGIPALVHEECVAGYMGPGGTNFPHTIGMAASFDPDLTERMNQSIAHQVRQAGAHQGLAPVFDVCRDPRWGRVEETAGEDPYLVATIGVAATRGLQGGDTESSIVATAKHFAGHGVPEGGLNSAPPHIGPRELREVFLTPFEAAVRIGHIHSFMHAYHELDGIPCIANRDLLVGILRSQWGFDGTMVSDYNGIEELAITHRMVPSIDEAAAVALECGVDVELPSTTAYGEPLLRAIESGRIDIDIVDQSVTRILRQKVWLGLFEKPYVDGSGIEVRDVDRAVALEAARRSLVLLKNDGPILPIAGTPKISVIGPSADDARLHMGDYSYAASLDLLVEIGESAPQFLGGLSDPVDPLDLSYVPTVLDAIRERAPSEVHVDHVRGCGIFSDEFDVGAAVDSARAADLVIFVGGGRSGMDDPSTTGEFRDRTEIGLPGRQQELLDAVVATGTPVALVLLSGRPLSPDVSGVAAVLHAWLPGDEGGPAIAAALFGDVSPGGKLPITVPRHVGQVPIYHGHKPTGGRSRLKGDYVDRSITPLWPFGYGMSYSSFELSPLRVDSAAVSTSGVIECSVDLANVGQTDADEVVQIYARRESASVTRPVRELVGFARVSLAAGERRTVRFSVPADLLGFVDTQMRFTVEPGVVRMTAATSSTVDEDSWVDVELTGAPVVEPSRSFFSTVTV
jgi:beta-glucosidase